MLNISKIITLFLLRCVEFGFSPIGVVFGFLWNRSVWRPNLATLQGVAFGTSHRITKQLALTFGLASVPLRGEVEASPKANSISWRRAKTSFDQSTASKTGNSADRDGVQNSLPRLGQENGRASDDQAHQEVLAAIFGQTRLDRKPCMTDDGKLTTPGKAVSRRHQFVREFEGSDDFVRELNGDLRSSDSTLATCVRSI